MAGAGAADAPAIVGPEEGAVRGAEDEVALAGQVAVRNDRQRHAGVGATVDPAGDGVAGAGDEAEEQGVASVCLFTRIPDFFFHFAFRVVDRTVLPDKIYKDCQMCPRLYACDEVAMVRGPLPRIAVLGPTKIPQPELVKLQTGTLVPAAYWSMEDGSNTTGFVLTEGTGTNLIATATPSSRARCSSTR